MSVTYENLGHYPGVRLRLNWLVNRRLPVLASIDLERNPDQSRPEQA